VPTDAQKIEMFWRQTIKIAFAQNSKYVALDLNWSVKIAFFQRKRPLSKPGKDYLGK